MFKICLDPGHGGDDPGAVGNGLQEKNLALAIALDLRQILMVNNISVVMTRDDDSFVDLHQRAVIAMNFKADLFLSIHINAGGGTGEEVLISGTGGKAETFAGMLLGQLIPVCGWRNRGVKVANIQVLRDTIGIPACLTESGFIDNMGDVVKLKAKGFIHEIAVAHAKAICEFAKITYNYNVKEVRPVAKNIDPNDIYLSVRVLKDKADQAIVDINKLGFACQRLELA